MRRPSAGTLIVLPWVLLTLASVLLFLSAAPEVTDQTIAIAVLVLIITVPTAVFVAQTIVRAIHELRGEAARLARLRSSPVDPQNIAELHELRSAITSATDELHARADALDLLNRRLRAVVESLTEGVIQLSGEGRFLHANAAARQLLHLPVQLEGMSIAAVIRYSELRTALQRAADGSSLQPTEITLDDRQLLISPRRLQFPGGGDIPGAVIGIVDLTQLRRLETVRRDFVANVSHELKTPLTSIRGYTETLLNDDLAREQQLQFLGVIKSNTDRLQRILEDLLDISRLQSGGWQPNLHVVDAAAITREVWGSIDAAPRKQLHFELVADQQTRVLADEGGLRQVLSNLLENAVRHTPQHGRITVKFAWSDGMTQISVTDTGSGIPREALPRIFERFFRVDAGRPRAAGGTGLGLSIVKHLVEQMKGSVTAQSEIGKGTTIRILLPTAPS
jgi:two-component system phosphate regulon sensor histidine kinase PhoR